MISIARFRRAHQIRILPPKFLVRLIAVRLRMDDVSFLLRPPVEQEHAVAHLDCVARKADEALDVRDVCLERILEDYHISAPRGANRGKSQVGDCLLYTSDAAD